MDYDFWNLSGVGLLVIDTMFPGRGKGLSTSEGVVFMPLENRDMREAFNYSNGYFSFKGLSFTALSVFEISFLSPSVS